MMFRRLSACVLVCLVPSLSGCTSMRTVRLVPPPAQPIYGDLKAGDTVEIETRDGERQRFVIQQIDGDTIIAPGGQRYKRDEIVKLQRKSFSAPKTVALVAVVFGAVFIIVAAAAAAALGDILGG